MHALMQFHYLVQSPRIDENDLKHISEALNEFHANKDAIIIAGVRRGKGNRIIDNWHIPKLELMQNIIPSIRNCGVTGQWTADVTEHAHITEIKDPARSSNNNNYNPQICRHLDRAEKCRRFELAASLLDRKQSPKELENDLDPEDDEIEIDADADIDTEHMPAILEPGHPRQITNYFAIAKLLQHREVGSVPLPLCSFSTGRTAFHLAYDPSIRNIAVDEVAIRFGLPDLRPAIADFLHREATHGHNHVHAIGGPRRAGSAAVLLFDKVQVWFKIRLQDTESHDTSLIRPAQTLNCVPPSDPWILGRYDTVIVQTDAGYSWPTSCLSGEPYDGHTISI